MDRQDNSDMMERVGWEGKVIVIGEGHPLHGPIRELLDLYSRKTGGNEKSLDAWKEALLTRLGQEAEEMENLLEEIPQEERFCYAAQAAGIRYAMQIVRVFFLEYPDSRKFSTMESTKE